MIHIEQQWEENVLTVEGGHIHRIADQPLIREKRGDKLIVRALPVRSRRLGVSGVCDVVEFVRHAEGISAQERRLRPLPVNCPVNVSGGNARLRTVARLSVL
nr:hypothetical protein [Paenibacillus cisolokensis]